MISILIFSDDILYNLIKVLMTTSMTLGLMFTLTKFKYSTKRIFYVFFIYLLWVAGSTVAILFAGKWKLLTKLFIFTVSAPAVLLTYFLAKDSPAQAVFNYVTQINLAMILTVTVTIANSVLDGNRVTDLLIRFFLFGLVILFEFRFIREPFRRLTDMISSGWMLLSIVPMAFCMLFLLCGVYPVYFAEHPLNIIYVYGIAVVMVIVYFVIFQSLAAHYRLQMADREKDILATQVIAIENQLSSMRQIEEAMIVQRHDMRHYVNSICALIQDNHVDEALGFIKSIDNNLLETKTIHYCENSIVNAVLSLYAVEAQKYNIDFQVKLDIPQHMQADSVEFSTVISNALENAVSACRVQTKGEKKIEIFAVAYPSFMLQITNTYSGTIERNKEGIPISTSRGHGIGSRSIQAFVKKYNGSIDYDIQPGLFRLRLIL